MNYKTYMKNPQKNPVFIGRVPAVNFYTHIIMVGL